MNRELYELRLKEVILGEDYTSKELNEELVEVQVAVLKHILNSYDKAVKNNSITETQREVMADTIRYERQNLIDYIKEVPAGTEIKKEIVKLQDRIAKTLQGLPAETKRPELTSSEKAREALDKAAWDIGLVESELKYENLDLKRLKFLYKKAKEEMEESYKHLENCSEADSLKLRQKVKELMPRILASNKALEETRDRLEKASETFKGLDSKMVEALLYRSGKIGEIEKEAMNGGYMVLIQEACKQHFEPLTKIWEYSITLGNDEKDADHTISNKFSYYPQGSTVKQDKAVFLTRPEYNFVTAIKILRSKIFELYHHQHEYVDKIKSQKLEDEERTALRNVDKKILVNIAKSKGLRVHRDMLEIATLIDELTRGVNNKQIAPDGSADSLRAVLIKLIAEGQKKVTFGVLTRKYLTEYAERVLKYKISDGSGIAQGYTIDFCGKLFGIYG